jgi:DNA-binding MarR family transcriptional regulator
MTSGERGPDPDLRMRQLFAVLADAVHEQLGAEVMRCTGLTPGSAAILVVAAASQCSTVSGIATSIGLTPSGTLRATVRLEAAGYVARRNSVDHRSVHVTATTSGHQVAQQVFAARQRVAGRAVHGLSQIQQAQLCDLVQVMVADLTRDAAHAKVLCQTCDRALCGPGCPIAAIGAQRQLALIATRTVREKAPDQ